MTPANEISHVMQYTYYLLRQLGDTSLLRLRV